MFQNGPLGVTAFFIILVSGIIFTTRKFFAWKYTVFVITDMRIIDIEQKGFFHKSVAEVAYRDIDEVTFRIKGIAPTLFRYGVVEVKIAGNAADLETYPIHRPATLHDLICEIRENENEET
jgi:hypothetical protein